MLPWLKSGGKINRRFYSSREPQVYWYYEHELRAELEQTGFVVVEKYSPHMNSISLEQNFVNPLLFVCKKE